MPKAWLLVYLADPGKPGERWLDKGNDPEMRRWPMTWGICRTDVRQTTRAGDDLYFVAYGADRPIAERYYLAARFHVAEVIDWPSAAVRFAGRPNVIVEALPGGGSVDDRVVAYARSHRAQLRWDGLRTRTVASLDTDERWLRDHARDFSVELAGRDFVHAYYDGHGDWRTRRLDGPYIVADETESKMLAEPIPYVELADECPELPRPEHLRTTGRQPRHNRRRVRGTVEAYLRERVDRAREWRPTEG